MICKHEWIRKCQIMNCVVCGKSAGWDDYCEECGFVAPSAECFLNEDSLMSWCKHLDNHRKLVLGQRCVGFELIDTLPNIPYTDAMNNQGMICPVCGAENDGPTSNCSNCGFDFINDSECIEDQPGENRQKLKEGIILLSVILFFLFIFEMIFFAYLKLQ